MYKFMGIFLFGLVMSGCVSNLAPVRSFSTDTSNLTKTLTPFVDDLPKSCKRRVEIAQIVLPDDDAYQRDLNGCRSIGEKSAVITELNQVLVSYADALAALAADNVVTYTGEIDAANDAITSLKNRAGKAMISKDQADAGLAITGFILKATTEAYRQKKIKDALEQHDNVEKLARALQHIIKSDYGHALENEEGNINSAIQDIKRRNSNQEPIAAQMMFRELRLLKDEIEPRKKAIEEYSKGLEKMIATHASLKKNADSLESKELLTLVLDYGREVYKIRKQIQKAF
ncbi:MAG: hypothetical protein ACXVB4_19395 [Pseudobdellovibrionaceae bacterium]